MKIISEWSMGEDGLEAVIKGNDLELHCVRWILYETITGKTNLEAYTNEKAYMFLDVSMGDWEFNELNESNMEKPYTFKKICERCHNTGRGMIKDEEKSKEMGLNVCMPFICDCEHGKAYLEQSMHLAALMLEGYYDAKEAYEEKDKNG